MSKATKMFIALVVALVTLLCFGLIKQNPTYCDVSSVFTSPGDTLWGIAKEHCHGNSTTIMVDDIFQLNPELKKRDLQPSETVKLPTKGDTK